MYGHGGFRGRRVACVGNRPRLPEIALICEIRIKWPRRLGVSGESVTYPNGPYGQGFPGQPGYPQQPVWPQHSGYPQPGYPGVYPPPPAGPSGATAIFAGLLALPGGIIGLILGGVSTFSFFLSSQEDRSAWLYLLPLICFGYGLSLLVGAFSLFRRNTIGRLLIAGGCAVVIVLAIVVTVGGAFVRPHSDLDSVGVPVIVGIVFPILTLVLSLLPSTTRWIEAKPNPIAPQYYPPYQG